MRQPKLAGQIQNTIERVRSKYNYLPVVLGTVEYHIYKYLLELGVQAKLFTDELPPEVEAEILEEAQRFAEEIALKVGGEKSLLFRGINLFDIILYDLTMHFAAILRVKQVVRSKATQPGLILLFTESTLPSNTANSDFPVIELTRIGNAKGSVSIGTIIRFLLRCCKRATSYRFHIHRHAQAEHSPVNDTRRVLFATIDTGTGNCVEPLSFVLEKLRENHDIEPFVAVDNAFAQEYLRERQFESSAYNYFDSAQGALHWFRSSRVFRHKSLELAHEHGPGTIYELFASSFLQRFVNFASLSGVYSRVLWLDHIFEGFRPAVVVTFPLHSHVGRVAARLAGLRKLPIMTFVPTWTYGMKAGGDQLAFRLYNDADFVIVPGEDCRQALVRGGADPKRILLVGNPKFDIIADMSATQDRDHVSRLFGARPSDLVFLVATYVLAPGSMEWVRALVRQLKMFSGRYKLIIKPHPDESPDEYERILEDEKLSDAAVSRGIPLYRLINASDIVFTGMSTVGSEAVLFNKPLICLNFSNVPYSVRYDEAGIALLVKTEEQILPTIEQVLHNPKVEAELEAARKRFQEFYAYRLDGLASERFVNSIRLTIDRGRNERVGVN
jgi:hypothetical protein